MPHVVRALLLAAAMAIACAACGEAPPPPKPRLLVYCGITMIRPVMEIGRRMEQQHGCEVVITKGASGDLLKALRESRAGDIFFPGEESFYDKFKDDRLVTRKAVVGANQAALLAARGNPKGLRADVAELLRADLYVVLGNPDSGSIGAQTRKILERAGILDAALRNARQLTPDSKALTELVAAGTADLTLNWRAAAMGKDVDILALDDRLARKERLVMSTLATSAHPELAARFLDMAASAEGRALFEREGFPMPESMDVAD